jgi:hypothetical protein
MRQGHGRQKKQPCFSKETGPEENRKNRAVPGETRVMGWSCVCVCVCVCVYAKNNPKEGAPSLSHPFFAKNEHFLRVGIVMPPN